MRPAVAVVVGAALALFGGLVYALAELDEQDPPPAPPEVRAPAARPATARELRNFRRVADRPTYWLGPRFAGLPVTHLDIAVAPGERVVGYGVPRVVGRDSDAYDLYPVSVTTWTGPPSEFAVDAPVHRLRGVPARICERCGDMSLRVRGATIYVERGSDIPFERIVAGLRPIGRERPAPGPLPPPRG